MKRMRKLTTLLLAGIMAMGTLTACGKPAGSDAPQNTPETGNPAEKNTQTPAGGDGEAINLTHWFWSDSDMHTQLMQSIVQKFNESNGKNITVNLEIVPWDGGQYSTDLLTAAVGGGGPDTAGFKVTASPAFLNNDLLEPLDAYIENWELKDDIAQVYYDTFRGVSDDGKLYLMPWNVQVLYVYYRPSYFEAVGIKVPETYEEFLEACRKCTTTIDGQQVYGYGMRGSNGGQEPWGSFIYARGGSFEDLTSPESVQGMQDFIDLYKDGCTPPSATGDGYNEIMANFYSGMTAMTIQHIGTSVNAVETFGDDVSAFPFPDSPDGRWTSLGDTETVMFKSCQHKEAAFEWMAFLAAGEGQYDWCTGTGNVPVSKTVQESDAIRENRFMQISIDGQDFAGILPIREETTEWISPLWPATIQQALLGEITAEEAMEILQKGLWGE